MEIKVGGLHFNHYGKSTTQLPPFSSQQNIFHWERSSRNSMSRWRLRNPISRSEKDGTAHHHGCGYLLRYRAKEDQTQSIVWKKKLVGCISIIMVSQPLSCHLSPPSRIFSTENGHQGIPCLVEDLEIQFPAQRKTQQLIIMAVGICFATEQRKNAYYRNDPIKYGLTAYWDQRKYFRNTYKTLVVCVNL